MQWGTPMLGNVTTLEGLHVTGKYRDRSMQHTCSRHAAWDLVSTQDSWADWVFREIVAF